MENEVKETVSIAISIAVISLIIAAAMVFSNLSYKAYNYKLQTDAINYRIKTKSELYNYFVNPNSELSGSDIIDFITVYDKAYKYIIAIENHEYRLRFTGLETYRDGNLVSTETANDLMWTQAYITELMGENVSRKFTGDIVDTNGNKVNDVIEIDGDVWLKFELED